MEKRSSARHRRMGVAVVALVGLGAACTGEPTFGPAAGGTKYTDNRTLTHRSIECNNSDYNFFNHFLVYTMIEDYDPTVLTSQQLVPNPCGDGTDNLNDDIYWFAVHDSEFSSPSVVGDYVCMSTAGTGSTEKCQRGRMRLDQAKNPGGDAWNLLCHEIGHAVGFADGTSGLSCMDGGNTGNVDSYMIGKINGYY